MSEISELIHAFVLDGAGRGTPLKWEEVKNWNPDSGPIWIHLDATHQNTETVRHQNEWAG